MTYDTLDAVEDQRTGGGRRSGGHTRILVLIIIIALALLVLSGPTAFEYTSAVPTPVDAPESN